MATTVTPEPTPAPSTNPTNPASAIEAKAVTVIAGVLAVVFAIHPGWNQSGIASGLESAVSAIIGGAVYIVHLFTARKITATK